MTGVAHSLGVIVSVAVLLIAVAVVTHRGSVPAGIFCVHPLLIPVRVPVLNVYVQLADGTLGAATTRLYKNSEALFKPSTPF